MNQGEERIKPIYKPGMRVRAREELDNERIKAGMLGTLGKDPTNYTSEKPGIRIFWDHLDRKKFPNGHVYFAHHNWLGNKLSYRFEIVEENSTKEETDNLVEELKQQILKSNQDGHQTIGPDIVRNLILEVCGVQPMTGPTDAKFAFRSVIKNPNRHRCTSQFQLSKKTTTNDLM